MREQSMCTKNAAFAKATQLCIGWTWRWEVKRMTKREAAVVMAFTGVALLVGDDFTYFHKYVEELMGRPVWTHELPTLEDEIKRRAYPEMRGIIAALGGDGA